MVGVPGRSRGCVTCKKRRIACDVQGPPCGPCIRSKRPCSFPQKHIFVLNQANSHKTIYRKPAALRQLEVPKSSADGENTDENQQEVFSDQLPENPSMEIISRPFGTLTALKQQLLVNACTANPTRSHEPYRGRPWNLTISAFADSTYALNSGPLACYASWAGRRDRDPYLVEASQRLYVQGLKEVQQAVNNPSTALRDETFGACFALIIYEAMECPDRSQRGYDVHVDGCSRLVKLRGASMHQDGAAHDLFRAFRFIDIIRAFETHRPSYLRSRAWTTLPWQNHPKSSFDSLMDLLAEGPGVLQKADRLEMTPPHRFLPAVIEMVEELLAVENRMQTYYAGLMSSHLEPLFWEVSSSITSADDSDISTTVLGNPSCTTLHFQDVEVARILTLYWSTLSMILSGLNDLQGAAQSLISNNLLSAQFGERHRSLALQPRDWLEPIRKVCQSADFCKTQGPEGVGNMVMAVPLDMVLGVMKNRPGCSTEFKEAKRVRQEISRNWLRVLQFSHQQV